MNFRDCMLDPTITFKAKGIYALMAAQSEREEFFLHEFVNSKNKYEYVRQGMTELLDRKYIGRRKGNKYKLAVYFITHRR